MRRPNLLADPSDFAMMGRALRLAKRGFGTTSPNPIVGALLVKHGRVIGQGWHRRAGAPHAEREAIADALARGHSPAGASLYVTLEPCCTHGRTPPCTAAILESKIARVVAGATDPNPQHAGRGFALLAEAGLTVLTGIREEEATALNEPFNHWIVHRTPFVTLKAALSLDGRIATNSGQSKWITGLRARRYGMELRQAADAILVGVNTVLQDDPSLTVRRGRGQNGKPLPRIILDSRARVPLSARIVAGEDAARTTIVVTAQAPARRIAALERRVTVLVAPTNQAKIDLAWLLAHLGRQSITHLLVEGGGEVNASFLFGRLVHRIAFFYAPKIIGGRTAPSAVGGAGIEALADALPATACRWRRLGEDLLLTARLHPRHAPHCSS